jgi:NADPH:quinone reductase-like Zn-dependent oxidoreductase
MKAIGVTEYGGPDALEVVELPEPHAGPGEVRLRVHAAAVNPTDMFVRDGSRAQSQRKDPPPYVPGMDAAGVVDEIGDEIGEGGGELAVGDRAMAIVVPQGSHGAYSEYVVVPAGSVVRVPEGVDDVSAATLPMNGLTARLTLDTLALPRGSTLAVTGAAGAFGGYVIQLAKVDGLRVVADASEADEELIAGLGADVIVRRGGGVDENIRAEVPEGVDGLADGAAQDAEVLGAVRDGGRIATVRGYTGPEEWGVSWHPVFVVEYAENHDKLDVLRAQVESGAVSLRVAATHSAEQAAEAHRTLEAGGVRGRLVLTF